MVKDPICGMNVDKNEARKKNLIINKDNGVSYFCSQKCKEKFSNNNLRNKSDAFTKIFPYLLGIIIIGFGFWSYFGDFMILYMGIFFIIFSIFKMLDWKGFVNAFSNYDLITKRFRIYGWIYPGLEFVIGIMYLTNLYIIMAAWVTLFIMGIGGIGVTIKLVKKEKFQCACLGTKINIPLTKVTLMEDVIMFVMALLLIFM